MFVEANMGSHAELLCLLNFNFDLQTTSPCLSSTYGLQPASNASSSNDSSLSPSLEAMDFFFEFLTPFIYSSAILGSGFVLSVLITRRKATRLPVTINSAICSLLVCDILTCLLWLSIDVAHRVMEDSPLEMNKAVCLTYIYSLVTFCNLQGYIQCLISLERVLAVCLPMQVRRIITWRRMVVALMVVFLVVCLLHVFYIVFGYEFSDGQCQLADQVILAVFNALIYCAIPLVVQVACTVAIIVVLFKRHGEKRSMVRSASRLPSTEIRLAVTLVMMNVVFVATTLPMTLLLLLLPDHFKSNRTRQKWAVRGDVAWILTMAGAVTDWIILLVLGKQIRRAVAGMCGQRRKGSESAGSAQYAMMKRSHNSTA